MLWWLITSSIWHKRAAKNSVNKIIKSSCQLNIWECMQYIVMFNQYRIDKGRNISILFHSSQDNQSLMALRVSSIHQHATIIKVSEESDHFYLSQLLLNQGRISVGKIVICSKTGDYFQSFKIRSLKSTDCILCREVRHLVTEKKEGVPVYDNKLLLLVMLQFLISRECGVTPLLPPLPGPLWGVLYVRVFSIN